MSFDFRLFDHINHLAGQFGRLDAVGRGVAVFGVLAILLLIQGLLWWPHVPAAQRWPYLRALAVAAVGCLVLLLVEEVITHFVLHREIRQRPAYGRWSTLLLSVEGTRDFPAWPVLFAMALTVPTWYLSRAIGAVCGLIVVSIGLALVFVGINYPLDVITGLQLGGVIGISAARICMTHVAMPISGRGIAISWCIVLAWGLLMALTMRPASLLAPITAVAPVTMSVQSPAPLSVQTTLESAVAPAHVSVAAASNGRLLAAAMILTVQETTALPEVTEVVRRGVNAAFTSWPQLGYLTVTVIASYAREHNHIGTLYTLSLDRAHWPLTGFAAGQILPGKKYFNAAFLAHSAQVGMRRP